MQQQDEAGKGPVSRRLLLNYVAIAILVAGLGSGEFIYWRGLQRGGDAGIDNDQLIRLSDSRAYDRTIETQVGTFGVVVNQWDQALGKLGEPGPLAATIIVISMLAAAGCFVAASRMPRN